MTLSFASKYQITVYQTHSYLVNVIEAFVSQDASFDLARNVLDGLQRTFLAQEDPSRSNAILSPLTPLTPSPGASTRSTPPLALDVAPAALDVTPGRTMSLEKKVPAPMPSVPTATQSQCLSDADDLRPGKLLKRPKKNKSAKKKARDKLASRRNRKNRKDAKELYIPNDKLAQKQISNANPVPTEFQPQSMKIASTGFVGLRTKKKKSRTYFLDELVGPKAKLGLKLQEWDGRSPIPIVAYEGLVMGVCAGIPNNACDWDRIQRHAAQLLEEARGRLTFDKKEKESRRGKFPAINVGISHGGGQPRPKILEQDEGNAPILKELMEDEAFSRISGFATGAFASWAPRLYHYQNDCLANLIDKDKELRRNNEHPNPNQEELRRNWAKSPWAAAALNFGPQTICFPHADYGNLAYGWCCITALGDYDYKMGGHLVLWDLGLVIEFPPGATILIPSSAIEHSNVRIRSGESRYSITQYSSGGLFRWVSNNFQTVENCRSTMTSKEIASTLEELSRQLDFGLSLYSTVEELERKRKISTNASLH